MFASSQSLSRYQSRAYSVKFSRGISTDVDVEHSLDYVAKLLTTDVSSSLRDDLIKELSRSLSLSEQVRNAVLDMIQTSLAELSQKDIKTHLTLFEILFKSSTGNLKEVNLISTFLAKLSSLHWPHVVMSQISNLKQNFEDLASFLPFPALVDFPSVPPPSSISDLITGPTRFRSESFQSESGRFELGDSFPSNSLILTSLIISNNGQSILINPADCNPPFTVVTSSVPSTFDSSHSEFSRLLSFGTDIPFYNTPPKNDPFPLRSKISESFNYLSNVLGGLELGLVYDRVIDIDCISSKLIVSVTTMSTTDLPLSVESNYQWRSITDYEHDFYQKYNGIDYRDRLVSLSCNPIGGDRYLKIISDWLHTCHYQSQLKSGFYLGYLNVLSDMDGLHLLVDSCHRDCIPMTLISDHLPQMEELAWLKTINLQSNPNQLESSNVDNFQDISKFIKKFSNAVDSLKSKLKVDTLGDLYDWEVIPLDRNFHRSKMIVFVTFGDETTFPESFTYLPINSFEVRHLSWNFAPVVTPLYRKTDELTERESAIKLITDDAMAQSEMIEQFQTEAVQLDRVFNLFRWYSRIISWIVDGSKPSFKFVKNFNSVPTFELAYGALEITEKQYERLADQFCALGNSLTESSFLTYDDVVSALLPYWAKFDKEDEAFIETELELKTTSHKNFVPSLKPSELIRDVVKIEEMSSSFQFSDLMNHVEYCLSSEDLCSYILQEIVESSLIETVDVPLYIHLEEILSEMIEVVEVVDSLTTETCLLCFEHNSLAQLESEQQNYRKSLFDLFNQPLPDYERSPFKSRFNDPLELLKTPFTAFIKDHASFF
ncbi:hypothetical protein GEMRC1_000739 [Eukaryota sp. GEM-RC1]